MMSSANGRQVAKRLHNRFVTRAKSLSEDDEFLQRIRRERRGWNDRHPEFRIPSDGKPRSHPPQSLIDEANRERGEDRFTQDEWGFGPYIARRTLEEWDRMIASIAGDFWATEDFPHPFPPDRHPARAFITTMMYLDTSVAIRDVGELFPTFTLEPGPMLAERGEWAVEGMPHDARVAVDGMPSDAEVGWCLPLYPDMTADDIKKAAPDIAIRLQQIYGDRSLEARIESLRKENVTVDGIAHRLGISVDTVKIHLGGSSWSNKPKV